MRTLLLVVALIATPLVARAQQPDPPDGATISSAQVSGFDLGRLSPGLQDEIARLSGAALDRERLRALAERIEAEQPRFVAAVRVARLPGDDVRVVFVVAHMRDQDREANVNARYEVEEVDVDGVSENALSTELRDELRTLVGKAVGSDAVGELERKLEGAVPDHEVRRRIRRGSRSGLVRLEFVFDKREGARWLHFEPLASSAVYHSEQGWGAYFDFPISGRDLRFTPIFAIDSGDQLIEEFSGVGLRVESRRLGTERLGASFEWTSFDQTWKSPTLEASTLVIGAPFLYDQRSTVSPMVSFAVTPELSVRGGLAITELEAEGDAPSLSANAFVLSLGYVREWNLADGRHDLGARFALRRATATLESDFSYTRAVGEGEYRFRRHHHTVLASGMVGGIDGIAPLFDRFALGDSHTLRGWDKYDIAPLGGDRMFHTSLEYRYRDFAFFLDTGSVWDAASERRVRAAAGFGFHPGPFFMTLGFPLNTDDVRAVFTTAVRFGGLGVRKY